MLEDKVILFNTTYSHACPCKHALQGTGGIFYQSVQLLYCLKCGGWQDLRKPIN
jgi:hypothetical protein